MGSSENTSEKASKENDKKSDEGSKKSGSQENRRDNRRNDRDDNRGRNGENNQRRRNRDDSNDGNDDQNQNSGKTIYVNNLSQKTKERHLNELFEPAGEIESAIIIREPHTDVSRGFGFVTFKTKESATNAMDKFNQTELKGNKISIQISKRGRPRNKTPGQYLGTSKNPGENRFGRYAY